MITLTEKDLLNRVPAVCRSVTPFLLWLVLAAVVGRFRAIKLILFVNSFSKIRSDLFYPAAYRIERELSIADVAVVLRLFTVSEKSECQALHIREHIYLFPDEPVIYEMISVRAEDKHVLRYFIRDRREIVKLQLLRVAVRVLGFISVAAVLYSPVDYRRAFRFLSENEIEQRAGVELHQSVECALC